MLLFEISSSMKPYPSVFHACTSKLRPVTGFVEQNQLDEVSNRIAKHFWSTGRCCMMRQGNVAQRGAAEEMCRGTHQTRVRIARYDSSSNARAYECMRSAQFVARECWTS